MSSAPRRERSGGTHVGVISNGGTLTPNQRAPLSRALALIRFNNPGRLTIHHGCGQGADEIAHRFARKSSDWLIYGHPASRPATDPGHLQTGMLRELNHQAAGKPRDQRDADIVNASHIVVVVLPYHQPGIREKLAAASAAGRKVVYVPRNQSQPNPLAGKTIPPQATAPVTRSTATASYTHPSPEQQPRQHPAEPAARKAVSAPRTTPATSARPARKRFGFPDEWYEAAVSALGMHAEVQDNGTAFDIVLTSGALSPPGFRTLALGMRQSTLWRASTGPSPSASSIHRSRTFTAEQSQAPAKTLLRSDMITPYSALCAGTIVLPVHAHRVGSARQPSQRMR